MPLNPTAKPLFYLFLNEIPFFFYYRSVNAFILSIKVSTLSVTEFTCVSANNLLCPLLTYKNAEKEGKKNEASFFHSLSFAFYQKNIILCQGRKLLPQNWIILNNWLPETQSFKGKHMLVSRN